jgi:hypothetical protein
MKALPNSRWRQFAQAVAEKPGHGALVRALKEAGLARKSTPANQARLAWSMSQDERMIAAIAEVSRNIIRVGAPEAVNAAINIIRDPSHRDHGRVVMGLIDRVDPPESRSRHNIEVVHKIVDPDQEALEELRALRMLDTPREKLLELFGHNGLDRLEARETADKLRRADSAKLIEAQPINEVHDG